MNSKAMKRLSGFVVLAAVWGGIPGSYAEDEGPTFEETAEYLTNKVPECAAHSKKLIEARFEISGPMVIFEREYPSSAIAKLLVRIKDIAEPWYIQVRCQMRNDDVYSFDVSDDLTMKDWQAAPIAEEEIRSRCGGYDEVWVEFGCRSGDCISSEYYPDGSESEVQKDRYDQFTHPCGLDTAIRVAKALRHLGNKVKSETGKTKELF